MASSSIRPSSIRRKMSYRKPAPQFVPTPPGSPAQATLLGGDPELQQVTDEHLSQLPSSWSHTLKPSLTSASQSSELTVPSTFSHEGIPTGWGALSVIDPKTVPSRAPSQRPSLHPSLQPSLIAQEAPGEEGLSRAPSQNEGEVPRDLAASPDRKRRKVHREYRPPTPPLPALHKRRRLTVSACPEQSTSQGAVPMNRELQQVNNVAEDREHQGEARSLRVSPSFTTERTFVSLGAPQPGHLGDTSMASGWSGGLATFVSESDPRLNHYALPQYNPHSMPKPGLALEFGKTPEADSPSSSWLLRSLVSCQAGLKKIVGVLCC